MERSRSAWIEARARIFCGNREEPRGTHRLKPPKNAPPRDFFCRLSGRQPIISSLKVLFLAEKTKRRRGVSSAILLRSAGGFRASDQFNARAQALQHMTRVPVAIRLSSSSLLLMTKTRLNRALRAILLLLANCVRRDIIQTRWMDSYLSIRIVSESYTLPEEGVCTC